MANAEKKTKVKKIERVIVEEKVVEDGVVLHLTQEEAEVLKSLTGKIGGDATARTAISSIYWALNGINISGTNKYKFIFDTELTFKHTVYIKDEK